MPDPVPTPEVPTPTPPPSLDRGRRAIIATGLCVNSSVPSFAIAQEIEFNVLGCLAGIAIFVVAATFLVPTSITHAILRNDILRRAFISVYAVRYVACLAPITVAVDIFVGVASAMACVSIEYLLLPGSPSFEDTWSTFLGTMVLTLVQGVALNIGLIIIALAIYGVARMFKDSTTRSDYACVSCGFDLRMQVAGQPCPECGSHAGSSAVKIPILSRYSNSFLVGAIILVTTFQAIFYIGASVLF